MFNTKYVGVSAEVNVYTPEIIIADSAGFEKNYEDQVLLILTATKKNRRDGRVHEPLEAEKDKGRDWKHGLITADSNLANFCGL